MTIKNMDRWSFCVQSEPSRRFKGCFVNILQIVCVANLALAALEMVKSSYKNIDRIHDLLKRKVMSP